MATLLFYKSLLCAYVLAAQVLLSMSLYAVLVKELAVSAAALVLQVSHSAATTALPQAAAPVEERAVDKTYLVNAEIAAGCEHVCELRLVQLETGSVERVLAAAPLLGINTVVLQFVDTAPCTFVLRATCPASSACHAPEAMSLDSPAEQQALSMESESDQPGLTHADMLLQKIRVKHMHEHAQGPESRARFAFVLQGVRRFVTWSLFVTLVGLQGCLLCRASRMHMLRKTCML